MLVKLSLDPCQDSRQPPPKKKKKKGGNSAGRQQSTPNWHQSMLPECCLCQHRLLLTCPTGRGVQHWPTDQVTCSRVVCSTLTCSASLPFSVLFTYPQINRCRLSGTFTLISLGHYRPRKCQHTTWRHVNLCNRCSIYLITPHHKLSQRVFYRNTKCIYVRVLHFI